MPQRGACDHLALGAIGADFTACLDHEASRQPRADPGEFFAGALVRKRHSGRIAVPDLRNHYSRLITVTGDEGDPVFVWAERDRARGRRRGITQPDEWIVCRTFTELL